jgi:uncharacterized membrane protein YfcA
MNRTFVFLAIAATLGMLAGGIGGSYLRGQGVNWIFVSLNVVLVVSILYFTFHKKYSEDEEEKISWAERKERRKKKKRRK